jgi:lipid II:glycine glycyltransferase (peptidoglycan interpeptide bridge formation enzyme)
MAGLSPEAAAWDAAILAARGHLLQSWRWGEFKSRFGWSVGRAQARLSGETGSAQILFKHRGPVTMAYVPRGPALTAEDPALLAALMGEIDRVCRSRRAISVILEPDRPLPLGDLARSFVPGPAHIQPPRTVKVPLVDDEALLAGMHQKTRYNVRLSLRKGVTVKPEDADAGGLDAFYSLMEDTSSRNEFGIHSKAYYRGVLDTFPESSVLLVARIEDGTPAAAMIVAGFGEEAIYLYGASSTEHRSQGPGFALQYEGMRWARAAGYTVYDLWGIPATDPETTKTDDGALLAGTKGADWRGLYEFKVRFGGSIVAHPPTLERRYVPILPGLARKYYRGQG